MNNKIKARGYICIVIAIILPIVSMLFWSIIGTPCLASGIFTSISILASNDPKIQVLNASAIIFMVLSIFTGVVLLLLAFIKKEIRKGE